MKKILSLIMALAMVVAFAGVFSSPAYADEADVSAAAYVVMDADSGNVLLKKNEDTLMYPASTTKMMTLALAYSKLGNQMDKQVTVSNTEADIPGDSSAAWFLPGEVISIRDAMMATYLISANDGANVLLEEAYGSIDAGVQAMNDKLSELGCTHSHFTNAHGYHDPNHYTTALDMAKIVRWGLSMSGFEDFLGNTHYDMPSTNLVPGGRVFDTQDEMRLTGNMFYSGAIGGKCGWTPQAGYTDVEVANVNGHTLISVVMKCGGSDLKYYDSINLFEAAKSKLASLPSATMEQAISRKEVAM